MTTTLSSRASTFANPAASYFEKSLAAILDPYSKKNPRGGICMSIAENRLCSELLLERMQRFNGYSNDVLNYTATNGMPQVRGTIAKFLSTRIFGGGATVNPDNLVLGVCSFLIMGFWCEANHCSYCSRAAFVTFFCFDLRRFT